MLTGNTSDAGVDTDSNGKFDLLSVDIEVDLLVEGSYEWHARLVDSNGNHLGSASNSGSLTVDVNTLNLAFDGKTIGDNGVDGPYVVTGFLIFGAGESLSAFEVATTQAFSVASFDKTVITCDIDGDGDVDGDDINLIMAARGSTAEPGDPRDMDGDGYITIGDARGCVLLCTNPQCVSP